MQKINEFRLICFLSLIFLLSSCSHIAGYFSQKENFKDEIVGHALTTKDYLDHLKSLSRPYLDSKEVKVRKINKRSMTYLVGIYEEIVTNNELVFDQKKTPSFYIIEDQSPFYFSLPGAQFFFSTGVISKYFKNEELLVSCLTREIFKSHKGIYEKRTVIPLGFMRTERMLRLTRVSVNVMAELNKLSFYAMRRARRDATAYLNWLQTQNKNTLDFSMQIGDTRNISREEFMFKNFLVLEDQNGLDDMDIEYNSSPGFYTLLRDIQGERG